MLRDDIIDVLHRYRQGAIKSADDAADEVLALTNMICGACGQVWTGEPCGQKDNGWQHQVCYPVSNLNSEAK